MTSTEPAPALGLESIVKTFPGVRALRGVSMAVRPGTVHALVGENGAGKSTLIKIATGAYQPDEGVVTVGGEPIGSATRRLLQARGIRAIYQERQIAADLTVAENVVLDKVPGRFGFVDWRETRRVARRRLQALGVELDVDRPARSLTVAQLQLLEIARAVSFEARVIVMDEPTASLSRHEVEPLFRVISQLRTAGVAVLFISHHLDEVFAVADDVTVLRDGEVVAQGPAATFDSDSVVTAMFGRQIEQVRSAAGVYAGLEPRLVAAGVATRRLDDVSLAVRPGEIVAVTGGIGAGVSELARVLAGAHRHSGTVTVAHGAHVRRVTSRRSAVNAGVAFLPADRKRQGLLLDKSVADNVMLGRQAVGRNLVMTPRSVRSGALELAPRANVKTAHVDVAVKTLSGGNQQKVMIGRWLGVDATVLIFDEPTAGIDISSKFEIYEALRGLARAGAAIVICSTDFQEVGQVADRVVVMRSGRIVGEVAGADATEHRLIEVEMGSELTAQLRQAIEAREAVS
ncbi:MAG: Monosaccharide-transporting ATPase [Ilumatobacteraceae bacterium]|nr:Monosaccharide-transporting ATPase [Ilumatobacteraceae bacterium]